MVARLALATTVHVYVEHYLNFAKLRGIEISRGGRKICQELLSRELEKILTEFDYDIFLKL